MLANSCTGARWRELPTGHPSRLPGRGTSPWEVLGGTSTLWLLPTWSPVAAVRIFRSNEKSVWRVQEYAGLSPIVMQIPA